MSDVQLQQLVEIEPPENPFPGLRPFEFHENHLFFGREGQSEQLISKLSTARFLAVVGTSGSGKSSLVRAGLLPALFGGLMGKSGSRWRVAIMRPGNDPLGNLARALDAPDVFGTVGTSPSLERQVMTETLLRRGSLGLVELTRQAKLATGENLLVLVDQFEELFRVEQSTASQETENERAAFVKLLLEAKGQREIPIYVVLTMRSDYLGDCAQFWDLPEAINESQYLIPRLTREQRREVITGPIAVGGATITPRLVNRLLNDVGDNPDQLPILQHALMRTWGQWQEEQHPSEPLDLRHYEVIGGLVGALTRHADEAYEELTPAHQQLAEQVFKCLTEKGTDNREVRRPQTVQELCAVIEAQEQDVIAVIEVFRQPGRSFLMPPAEVQLTADSLIDIAHESLIRNWQKLKSWVEEEAQSAATYKRLAERAELAKQGKEELLRDPALQLALDWQEKTHPNEAWAQRYHTEFSTSVEFLQKSQKTRADERHDRERRRQQELQRARRTTIAFALLFLLASVFAGYGYRQRSEALKQKENAETREQEAIAQRLLAEEKEKEAKEQRLLAEAREKDTREQRQLAIEQRQLAIEQREKTEEQTRIAREQTRIAQEQARIAQEQRKKAEEQRKSAEQQRKNAVAATRRAQEAFESERRTIAASAEKERLAEMRGRDTQIVSARLAADARSIAKERGTLALLLSVAANGLADIGESRGSLLDALLRDSSANLLRTSVPGHKESVRSVSFSPDGKLLASGSGDQTIQLWEVVAGKSFATLPTDDIVRRVTFSQDGKLLAAAVGKAIQLWDVATRTGIETLPKQGNNVRSIAFSPDGTLLASGNEDSTIHVWHIAEKRELNAPPHEHKKAVSALVFSADGSRLVSGSEDSTIRVWDVKTMQSVGVLTEHQGPVRSIALSHNGSLLASGSEDSTIRLWDMATNQSRGIFFPEHKDSVRTVAFSPDGQMLASGSEDATVRLWDVATRRQLGAWDVAKRQRFGLSLISNEDTVRTVAFSPDGSLLASGGQDGTLGMWDVSLESWKKYACQRAKATLTKDQWKLYVGNGIEYRDVCPGQPAFEDVALTARRTRTAKEKE